MIRRRTQVRPNLTSKTLEKQADVQSSHQVLPVISVSNSASAPALPSAPPAPEKTQNVSTQDLQLAPEVPATAPTSDNDVQLLIQSLNTQDTEPVQPLALKITSNKNVRMRDLLFYNPPLTAEQKTHKKGKSALNKTRSTKEINPEPERETETREDALEHEQSVAPKVKIGLDGMMVLDESSTVINRKNTIRDQEAIIEDNDDLSSTNYSSFRRRPTSTGQTKWSENDNRKFYRALSIVGPDFTLMENLFFSGTRTRKELHKKFKREEKYNKLKVDLALTSKISVHSDDIPEVQKVIEEGI